MERHWSPWWVGLRGLWIAYLSLDIEPACTHMKSHIHTSPALLRERTSNKARVWALTIRQQSWWSPSLTSVTLPLSPLWGHCSLRVTDSLLCSSRHLELWPAVCLTSILSVIPSSFSTFFPCLEAVDPPVCPTSLQFSDQTLSFLSQGYNWWWCYCVHFFGPKAFL